ncbi:MAG: hypothetical protein SFT92_04155 [Rickettsiales bacterium]|nr:hypothetical protein [Rickettsiales bacterium]
MIKLQAAMDARIAQLPPHVKVLEVDPTIDFRKPHEAAKLAKQIHQLMGIQQGWEKK